MSDNVIQALDDVALAIRELALAQYPPPTTELSDIAAAIADIGVSSAFDYRYALEAIASAISNRACCPVPVEPLVIYDCANGEVRFINPEDGTVSTDPPPPGWRWPPRLPGGSGVAPEDRPPTEGVVIYEPDVDPPITFTENDPPYGDDPGDNFDTTPTGSGDDNRCEKANVFVQMTYDMLETMSVLASSAGGVTLGALMATPAFAAWVGGVYITWGPFVEVPGKIILGVLNVVYAAIEAFTNLIDFTTGWNAQVAEDLVCAIHQATSEKDMKTRWKAAVEKHYDWFAPQAVLIKTFLNSKWTGPLIDPTAVATDTAPRYGVVCATACVVVGRQFSSKAVYMDARPGIGLAAGNYYVVDINSGDTSGYDMYTWVAPGSQPGDESFDYFGQRDRYVRVVSGSFQYARSINNVTWGVPPQTAGMVLAPDNRIPVPAWIFSEYPFVVEFSEVPF